jgi:hypothetical protein
VIPNWRVEAGQLPEAEKRDTEKGDLCIHAMTLPSPHLPQGMLSPLPLMLESDAGALTRVIYGQCWESEQACDSRRGIHQGSRRAGRLPARVTACPSQSPHCPALPSSLLCSQGRGPASVALGALKTLFSPVPLGL